MLIKAVTLGKSDQFAIFRKKLINHFIVTMNFSKFVSFIINLLLL